MTPDTKRLREWECKPGCHLQPHDGPCLTETEIAALRRVEEAARVWQLACDLPLESAWDRVAAQQRGDAMLRAALRDLDEGGTP